MPQSAAQQLASLITQAVTDIEADLATQIPGAVTTDVNSPEVAPADALEVTPKRREAIRTLKAATHQLLATLMPVGLQVLELQQSFYQTAALNMVLEAHIADLIHSLDPDSSKGGVHVDLLAEKAHMDPRKLSHILRFLAIHNVFCETTPSHWSNTRCSLPLRTDSPNSLWNYLMHIGQDVSAAGLIEFPKVLLDDKTGGAFSWEHSQSAFHRYWKCDGDFFQVLAQSENGYKAERFGKGMTEVTQTTGVLGAFKGFDWKRLGSNGTLVDVGGGVGTVAHSISLHLPDWKIVVQDRDEVIKDGRNLYKNHMSSNTNVEFEVANFFEEQPAHRIGTTDVYFLRHILHDWPTERCIHILSCLRKAAKPTSRLLVCEINLEPPLLDPNSPILSNGGMATTRSHSLNLTMLTLFNSEERDEEQYRDMFHKSGWMLESVAKLLTLTDVVIFEGVPDPNWHQRTTIKN